MYMLAVKEPPGERNRERVPDSQQHRGCGEHWNHGHPTLQR